MTTLNEARSAAYDAFLAGWRDDDGKALTPFCFDNETIDSTDDWARCSVRSIAGGQQTLGSAGNRKYLRRAIVRVEVYVQPGRGLEAADALVQTALGLFEGRSLPGTTCRLYDAQTAEVGLTDEDRWFLSTMQASFDYEQIK